MKAAKSPATMPWVGMAMMSAATIVPLTVPEGGRLKNISLRELIADIEKRIIVQTLERVDGSQKRAAEELRLNPTTLHEKMKRYKILPSARRQRV